MMKNWMVKARTLLLELLANPGVFVFTAFTVSGMFMPGALGRWRGVIELNVILPWGLALCLLRLYCASRTGALRRDVCALGMLLAWLIVPFAMRFGPTGTNINTWQNSVNVFFGIYALTVETDAERFDRQLRVTTALFAVVTAVFAGALLYCAATVQVFYPETEFGFGVYQYAQLCAAQHYNATGMLAMCAAFICLAGMAHARGWAERLLHLIPAVMAVLVVILSQSRTARYSLLIGLAVGAYGAVASGRWNPRAPVRHAAGVLAGIAVLAGGYLAASGITDAALLHYAKVRAGQETVSLVSAAQAEEMPKGQDEGLNEETPLEVSRARGLGEGTFTGRTDVWKNIFSMWKENPKYFLIGNGVGRTSRDILIGTPLEHGGANMAHNAFIQFTMDNGLIALLLLLVFALTALMPVLRTLYAAPGTPGAAGRFMCMLVVACLMTAMMENEPLSAMRPCNVVMFYALACAVRMGDKHAEAF